MARYRRVCLLVGLLLLICATTALKCPEKLGSPGREIVCYTSSSDLERLENAICRCTTLVHQGHDLQNLDASELKSLRDSAKEANPSLRVVLSINDKHELLKTSATTRQEAAEQLIDILKEVDGVELNVTVGSKDRLVSFVKGLKEEMVNKSLEKMILLALPTKPEDLAKQFELKELSKYVDLFTVATHYLRDNDEAYRSFHPSRLMGLFDMLNTDSLVDLISGMGAPKQKILISAPASVYQFTLRKAEDNTPRSSTVEEQPVVYDRKKLCDVMNDGEWTVERDEDLTAPYSFKNTTWIAFEDGTSLKIKGKYVLIRELAGLALRDVENDLENDCGMPLSQSVYGSFTEMKRKTRDVVLSSLEKDLKGTDISYPRHVRSSDFRIVRVVDTEGKIRAVRENTQTAFTCTRQGFFVHPKSCNRFYRCVKFNQEVDDYSVFEFDCPAGLAFDERTEVCVWPGSLSKGSACPGSSEIEPVPRARFRCPSQPGFYADPQNCRWFFACYDLGGPEMVPYEFRCPFGLVFDEHRLLCEWPWKVPNCNGHGHGDGHSIYTYGGNYGGQGKYVPEGGIIDQGGFVGQGGYAGEGIGGFSVYDNQDGHGVAYGSEAYDGQNFNEGAAAGAGAGYDGQIYNAGGAAGAGAGYDGQTSNPKGVAGAGVSYDGQTYNAAGAGAGYNGQTYTSGGAVGAGAGYDGQTYNAGGAAGAEAGYNSQTYNTGEAAGAEAGYNGQTYNAGGVAGAGASYDGQTYNAAGAGAGYNGQTYNAAGAAGAGAGYDGQTSNPKGVAGAGVSYDGQTYNAAGAGAGYNGQTYTSGGAVGAGAGYDGQTYNAGGAAGAEAGYNGQTYNAEGAVGVGVDYDSQTYNVGGTRRGNDGQNINAGGIEHNGQTYNVNGAPGTGNGYDGQTYNAVGVGNDGQSYSGVSITGGVTDYGEQSYNVGGTAGVEEEYNGQTYNANGAAGQDIGRGSTINPNAYDGQNFNAGGVLITGAGINGQNPNANTGSGYNGQVFSGPGTGDVNGADCNDQNFNGDGVIAGGDIGTEAGVNTNGFDGQNVNTGNAYSDKGVFITSNDYDDRGGATPIISYNGPAGRDKTTQYNSGGSTATVGVNNLAGNTRIPTGFTTGPANFAGGDSPTIATGGVNNFAGTTGFSNTEFTKSGQAQNTNFNSFDSTAQTGLFGGVSNAIATENGPSNAGLSTISYGNTAGGQSGTSLFGIENTQYTGGAGVTVYNSSYSASPGYPSSTIIPFVARENTLNAASNGRTTPVNSVIYHSHVAMGLSTTENLGKQYTNQAEKSFTTPGRIPAGFAFNGRTQNFNTATNVYDHSKVNLAGVTPSITLVRDDVYNTGGTAAGNSQETAGAANFGGSTITTAGVTNAYDNSQIIGSNIASVNNDITKFRDTTGSPDDFQFNGNTAVNTGYRTDSNTGTFYNQGTTANQKAQNTQGTPIPGVVPLNNLPAVELDNSGIFGTNFVSSTTTPSTIKTVNLPTVTAQSTGYRTNEYYDNGGRGTIRYNNGLVANKVTETGTQDYRTSSYTRIPNSFIITSNTEENAQSTIQRVTDTQKSTDGIFTQGGFTKTGPTKTGITTAQVGGSGSYVIGTGTPRARPNPQYIGEHAFSINSIATDSANFNAGGATTNFGTAGTDTTFGSVGNNVNIGPTRNAAGTIANFGATGSTVNFGTSPLSGGFTSTEFSKSNTASVSNTQTAGYSYPKPLLQLEVNGLSTTPGVTQTNFIDVTTPSSLSTPQTFENQNSVIIESSAQNNRGVSTTVAPIGFTTNQLDNFRTTVYQAAKLPQAVTTIRPIIDTGYKTVISSTSVPAIISTQGQTYQTDGLSTRPNAYLDVGVNFDQDNDYYSSVQGSTGGSDYSDVTSNFEQGNFGQKIAGQTRFTNINYQQPSTISSVANQNSKLIKVNQEDHNLNSQTGANNIAQIKSTRRNQISRGGFTGAAPKQVYISSSTIAPAIGVTFGKPIVAAEFSQSQIDQISTTGLSQNTNAAGSTYNQGQGPCVSKNCNRILSNQASAIFVPQKSTNGILINQASADFAHTGSTNGILSNQASASFNSQALGNEFSNNQAALRRSNNRIVTNQGYANFVSQGSSNGFASKEESSNFGSRVLANNQAADIASRGSSGVFSNQVSSQFGSQGSSNQILSNQDSVNSFSGQNQGLSGKTRTLIGSNVVTSIGVTGINEDIIRQNGENRDDLRITQEFRGTGDVNFNRVQQSTTVAPEVTTFSGGYGRTQTRIESNAAFNTQNQNKKVIVKLSDLHPLILGKLGAECTCKADPFAIFRGSNRQALPINSQNRGPVDLANYDESEIYVDIDSDKENEREIDFVRNTPSNRLIKTSNVRLSSEEDDSVIVSSRGEPPSSTYLPPTTIRPSSTYLPPVQPLSTYLPSSTVAPVTPVLRQNQASSGVRTQNRQPLLIRVENDSVDRASFPSRGRSGKALINGPVGSRNDLRDQGASFDRYGPAGLRSNDETLKGELDCARPGLFRHPKYCNKFYACHWDNWKKRYTLHVFNCPVHLAFDASTGACNYPSKGPACQDNKLLL